MFVQPEEMSDSILFAVLFIMLEQIDNSGLSSGDSFLTCSLQKYQVGDFAGKDIGGNR